ncbi:hypothetical protein [Magnetospirillum moscoviense]|uniref:Uncharacterized protein n=1 Tax=Magnetospirillum moscoviense TaxID=1437059 RepID=A0A178MYJ5_9PROT|nr:hypothetical protein [Magnetospirillum moscoviense]OAN55095.1 hypothetical protein A6A05_00610 [Magnetospirillum moscoviense]
MRRYLWIAIGAPLVLLATVGAANLLFMARINELMSEETVRALWAKGNTVFNAMTINDPRPEIIRALDPEIFVIGSSRSFHLRDYAFSRSFFSLGGALGHSGYIDRGMFEERRRALADVARPRYLLLFLDYWWFMRAPPGPAESAGPIATQKPAKDRPRWGIDPTANTIRRLTLPTTLMKSGSLTPSRYLDVLLGRVNANADGLIRIGYGAAMADTGFGSDGSYYYLWLAKTDLPGRACDFAADLARKKNLPHGAYRSGQSIDPRNIEALKDMIARLEKDGTRVVPIIPPISPAMARAYEQDPGFAYIAEWRATMKKEVPSLWDFHDPRPLGSSECEFLDDIHGADVTYLRILQKIGESDPTLRPILRMDEIKRLVTQFTGRQFVTAAGLGDRLPKPPPPSPSAPKVGPTESRPSPPGSPADHPLDRSAILMSERAAANADFLARMPDYDQRVYQRVQTAKNRELTTLRLAVAVGATALIVLALLLWRITRLTKPRHLGPSPNIHSNAAITEVEESLNRLERDLANRLENKVP